jgi:hypothetical protein
VQAFFVPFSMLRFGLPAIRSATTTATVASFTRRALSANARYELPAFAGEPFKHYAPGSPEAINLKNELRRAKSEVCETYCLSLIIWFGDRLLKSRALLAEKNISQGMSKNKSVIHFLIDFSLSHVLPSR